MYVPVLHDKIIKNWVHNLFLLTSNDHLGRDSRWRAAEVGASSGNRDIVYFSTAVPGDGDSRVVAQETKFYSETSD